MGDSACLVVHGVSMFGCAEAFSSSPLGPSTVVAKFVLPRYTKPKKIKHKRKKASAFRGPGRWGGSTGRTSLKRQEPSMACFIHGNLGGCDRSSQGPGQNYCGMGLAGSPIAQHNQNIPFLFLNCSSSLDAEQSSVPECHYQEMLPKTIHHGLSSH